MTDLIREEAERLAREYMMTCGYTEHERPKEHHHFKAFVDTLQRTVNVKVEEAKEEEAKGWRITVAQLQRELAEACEKAKG